MRATSLLKQAFIRSLGKTAADAGVSFYDLVFSTMQGKVKEVQGGKILVQVQASGVTSQYQVPLAGVNAETLSELCAELLGVIEEIRVTTPTVTDEQIIADLVTYYSPVQSVRSDFGGMRL